MHIQGGHNSGVRPKRILKNEYKPLYNSGVKSRVLYNLVVLHYCH